MNAQDSNGAELSVPLPLKGAGAAEMAAIGADLREVRERLGWKLPQVAAELRIREPYLDAIEQGRLEALPGPAYRIGFVRAYAQALGLDDDEILRRFRATGGVGTADKPELSFLAPVPDRAVPSGAILLLGVVLLLAGYGLWFLHTESDRTLAASVPPVPAALAPLAVPAPPAVKAPTAKLAAAKPAIERLSAATPAATAPAPAAAMKPPAAAAAAAARTITATADTWVEVKDATGNILLSRLMHSGDRWPVPDLPGLTLTAGNAGGTEIAGGAAAGTPLGGAGTVVRNFALTAGPTPTPASPVTP